MSEEGSSEISRRSFMKTAALATSGVAGAALAAEVVTPLASRCSFPARASPFSIWDDRAVPSQIRMVEI